MDFRPFVTPLIFFQKSGSVTFVPLWCPNFMQNKTSIQWTPLSWVYCSKFVSSSIIFGQKFLKCINYASLSIIILNYSCKRHYLTCSAAHHLKKTHGRFLPDWLKIFRENVKKVKKLQTPSSSISMHHLFKASCEISVRSLEDFLYKGRVGAKTHKLCLIMLINSSWPFSRGVNLHRFS